LLHIAKIKTSNLDNGTSTPTSSNRNNVGQGLHVADEKVITNVTGTTKNMTVTNDVGNATDDVGNASKIRGSLLSHFLLNF